jgi:hypothetical protein
METRAGCVRGPGSGSSHRRGKLAGAVRLQAEELEQAMAMDGAFGNPVLFGGGAHAPVCCCLGLARGCGDQIGHRLIFNRAAPAATRLVVEPRDPIGDEAIAPFADRTGGGATMALLDSRSHASTIFARNVSAAGSERDRVIAK